MSIDGDKHRIWSFGDFSLDIDRGSLSHDGQEVKLRPQSFEVLSYLVQRHGVLVSKRELLDAVWGDKAVTDDSLTHCLIDIRKALDDDERQKIRTIPRRGFIFEIEVEELNDKKSLRDASAHRRRLVAAVAIIVGALGVWFVATDTNSDSLPIAAAVEAPPKSIAVLPFNDMSESQDQRYFAHGMSEEIINLLTKTSTLRVTARTSSFSFEDQNFDIAEIAEQLNVKYVLEGSIRKVGSRIRVTAQLVNGQSMVHLWSETFDREQGDALRVQSEIAGAVADVLKMTLLSTTRSPQSSPAYDLYLQGKFIFNRRASGDLKTARSYFLRAIESDPEFAPAWAGLAGTYSALIFSGEIDFQAGLELVREAAETAVALDPELAEARLRLAQAYYASGEHELSVQLFEQALAEHPNHPLALAMAAGIAGNNGDLDRAIELQRRAASVDPLNVVNQQNLAAFLAAAGRYDEAIEANRRMSHLNPGSPEESDGELARLYILLGRNRDALAIIKQCPTSLAQDQGLALVYEALGRSKEATGPMSRLVAARDLDSAIRLAEIYAHSGNLEGSFEQLQRVFDAINTNLEWYASTEYVNRILFSPFLRPLHPDQRWIEWRATSQT